MEIPLATFADASLTSGVGEDTRVSDHATVAMNSNRDILVAFHSHRADLGPPPLGRDPLGIPELKQVEVAFFEYRGDETWGWRETQLVGSVDYSPVQLLTGIPTVSCERPDIIADGDRFFVSWTRQYHKDSPGATFEPAVLECAWIEIVPGSPDSSMEITGHEPLLGVTPQPGRGFELDIHVPTVSDFLGRECKVTPDAVALIDPTDEFKVAVAYSHQTDFSETTPGDTTRSCEVRMVTCTFDPNATGYPITHVASFPALQQNVQFDGVNPSTGFILPDLAPSGEENAFWMVTEAQEVSPPPASLNNGAIRLGYWKLQSGNWVNQASRTFSSLPGDPYLRRRPMISAYPEGTGEQVVAVTFSKVDNDVQTGDDPSAQVISRTHVYQNGGLSNYPMPGSGSPAYLDYPNDPLFELNDAKPTIVRGRTATRIQFCLADQASATGDPNVECRLQAWDQDAGLMKSLVHFPPPGPLGRPAVDYLYFANAGVGINPDYIPVAWEAINPGQSILRCKLGVLE